MVIEQIPCVTPEWRAALLSLVHTLFHELRRHERVSRSAINHLCDGITEVDVHVLREFVSELVTAVVKRQLALGEHGRVLAEELQTLIDSDKGHSMAEPTEFVTADTHLKLFSPRQTIADRARRTIDTRFAERLTVRSLAERLNTPAAPLSIAFRQRFGLTIHGYLTRVRVAHGIAMIRAGVKVEAAALSVGYRSRKDLYAAVSKSTGLTLSQLRPHESSITKISGRAERLVRLGTEVHSTRSGASRACKLSTINQES